MHISYCPFFRSVYFVLCLSIPPSLLSILSLHRSTLFHDCLFILFLFSLSSLLPLIFPFFPSFLYLFLLSFFFPQFSTHPFLPISSFFLPCFMFLSSFISFSFSLPSHHGMVRPGVAYGGDGFQMWKVAANMLNKQSQTADKGWSSRLEVG
jgi:hypothetical protein